MKSVWYKKRCSSFPRRSSSSSKVSRRQKRKQNARRASRERERERKAPSECDIVMLSRESIRVALLVRHINVAHFFSNSINLRAPASLMRCAHRYAHLKEGFFLRRGGEKKEEEEEEEKVHDDDDDDDGMMMMMMMRAFTTLCEKRPRLWVHCHRLRGGGITEILSMRTTTMQ